MLHRTRIIHGAILLGGLLVGQVILFGPSLIGRKILLPLDILAEPGFYLPPGEALARGRPWDWVLTDIVLLLEPQRRLAVSEVRAGRMPLWDPHQFCGAPLLADSQSSVFSPFRWLDYLWPGPWVLAWDQALKALVAGTGAYWFFRRSLNVSFAAAAIGAWIWSLSGYSVQWAGYPASAVVAWLPWMFYFTNRAILPGGGMGAIGLALTTCACLVSGHAETAAQAILIDALFFIWRFFEIHGWRGIATGAGRRAALAVMAGWLLGSCLSAPQSLPTLEYARTSYRVAARMNGPPETPPVGFKALPQLFLPDFNGATRGGGYYFGGSENLLESASVGYVGLITALVFAPLAVLWRGRRLLIFFVLLGLLGVGQILDLPLLNHLYVIFPLNLMRENRLVVAKGWSITAAGVMGLDTLSGAEFRWRGWLLLAVTAPAALGAWRAMRSAEFPEALQNMLVTAPPRHAAEVSHWFSHAWPQQAGMCAAAMVLWFAISRGMHRFGWFIWAIGLIALAEVMTADFNVYPQSDPSLYYPPAPLLESLARAPAGRVCGENCLPACLTETAGLPDVRGYDGFSPRRIVELPARPQPNLPHFAGIANKLQFYFPATFPSPITRMINLRYMIFAGAPRGNQRARYVSDGYWASEDATCLPRVFVPRRFQIVDDDQRRLQLLASADFDPAEVAYVESPAPMPGQPVAGSAKIVTELPSHLTIEYDLATDGLVVLSDLWDAGWAARINGRPAPVLRVNHAFRGVIAPAGKGVIQYDYMPVSFEAGLALAGAAGVSLGIWGIGLGGRRGHGH